MDFYKCQQAAIADDIEFFCRIVKEQWGRPVLTGVFYGYMQFGLCRQAVNGHLAIQRLQKVRGLTTSPGHRVIMNRAGKRGAPV